MTYALGEFSAAAMARLTQRLRECSRQAVSLQGAAQAAVDVFSDEFEDDGRPAFPLIRLFATIPFADLPPGEQQAVREAAGGTEPDPSSSWLTLMATRGERTEWSERTDNSAPRAIALKSTELGQRLPLTAATLAGCGPSKNFHVLLVPQALGHPLIRDQQMVLDYGVSSAMGFGGMLPSGLLFAMVLFSRPPIDESTAAFFQPFPTALRLALLPRLHPAFDPPR